jgi:hypothetical protein
MIASLALPSFVQFLCLSPRTLVPCFCAFHNSFRTSVSKLAGVNRKPVRIFRVFFSSAMVALVLSQSASGQSGSFTVSQLGKQVGTASFKFVSTPNGYDSNSTVRVSMKGLEYTFSKTEQLSAANELKHVQLSATVNGSAVNVVAVPDSAQLVLNISANGKTSSTRLESHPAAVFMPDFDPGALETLLALGVSRNNRDLWAIFPKQSGDKPATISAIKLATFPDEQGTLNGQPITVHHLVANIDGASTDLFSGPDNELLQAELPQQGFALIRVGFILKPSAKAGAAPAPEK